MWFSGARKAERFKTGRAPQEDSNSIKACGYQPESDQGALALTIRRVIGECGKVDSQYIRAEDRWPEDLGALTFWDSIDLLDFVFRIEKATGIKFYRNEEIQSYYYSGFTVAGLVQRIVPHLEASRGI
jgi:acyl carrier protein